jgi:hypothetical protein
MKVKYIEFYMEDVSSVVSSPFLVRFDLLIDGERVCGGGRCVADLLLLAWELWT